MKTSFLRLLLSSWSTLLTLTRKQAVLLWPPFYTLLWHLISFLSQLLALFLIFHMQSLLGCNESQHAQTFVPLCLRIVIAANNKD